MKKKFWLYWTILMWLFVLAFIRDSFVSLESKWLEQDNYWAGAFGVMALVKHRLTGSRPWEL